MKVLLLTGYDDNLKEIGDITSRVMADYATKHGIDFLRVRQYEQHAHPSWQKAERVKDLLKLYKRVIWLDADTLITNLEIEPHDHRFSDTPLSVSRDWGTDAGEEDFSMGNFVAEDTCWSSEWLWERLEQKEADWANEPLWEQSAARELYKEVGLNFRSCFHILPRRVLNPVHASLAPSAPEPWQPGDWLCHLTGEEITNEKRMKVLRELLPTNYL